MFKLSILLIILVLSSNIYSQDMVPPPPATNAVYDAMVGEWTSESSMMGTKMASNLRVYWDVNHQFLVLDLRSTGIEDATQTYQGKGLFGLDAQGNAKTWWFDSWGAMGVGTATGAFSESKLTLTGGNDMYKETRSFMVSGNEMVMSAKGTMNMGGKEVPFDETMTFRK